MKPNLLSLEELSTLFNQYRNYILAAGIGLLALSWVLPESASDTSETLIAKQKLKLLLPGQKDMLSIASDAIVPPQQEGQQAPLLQEGQSKETLIASAPMKKPLVSQVAHIKSGDTLESVFLRQGLSRKQLHELLASIQEKDQLSALKPKQKLVFYYDENKQWKGLDSHLDLWNILQIRLEGDAYTSHLEVVPADIRIVTASGEIQNNLFLAGQKAGLSDASIMQLANIFGWDVDFALDIRPGDNFNVVYQKIYRKGEYVKNGRILAADFTNRGDTYEALYYTDSKGESDYYAPDGRRMRKAFLRSPVEFTRISSRFTYKRKHPVLKGVTRPHRAVDYAADRGTPVITTGDGKVIFSGRGRQLGNYVKVQHANKYVTIYAHLSKFSKYGRKGKRVKQGQIIGYVGSTGLASGPHLHYEFRVNGVHKDPTKIKFPAADPLPATMLADFKMRSAPLQGLLKQQQLATTQASQAGGSAE